MELKKLRNTSIKVLVDETLSASYNHKLESIKFETIKTFPLSTSKEGFLTLIHNQEELDFPLSWGIFDVVHEDNVIDISACDEDLNSILNGFLGLSGSFRLVKSTEGFYFIHSPQIKKAA